MKMPIKIQMFLSGLNRFCFLAFIFSHLTVGSLHAARKASDECLGALKTARGKRNAGSARNVDGELSEKESEKRELVRLAALVKTGDSRAVGEFDGRARQFLLPYVIAELPNGDEHLAADVLQETLIATFSKIVEFDRPGMVVNGLRNTADLMIKQLRKDLGSDAPVQILNQTDLDSDASVAGHAKQKERGPQTAAQLEELKEKVNLVLATLSPRARQILMMRIADENMQFGDIGAAFSISGNQARVIYEGTLRKLDHPLRRMLVEDYAEGIDEDDN